ncbi:MAG TPA: LysE family translocator [Steroidobacteraceae bacterium]|nr:LysE family translocator [Steroidobacteraceae bacterium]
MDQTAHLWLFFLLVFGTVLLPGLDMAFILASALSGGRKSGLAAVAGIMAGGVCHVALGATGIAVLLKLFPSAFNGVLLLGALYVAWIGVSLMRGGAAFTANAQATTRSVAATFRQGVLTSLLNPKAYMFMLAIFPQFFRPEYGPLWTQALVLWLIIAVTQAGIYGGIALLAAQARGWLERSPAANLVIGRSVGAMLILAAMLTGFEGWHRL